MRYPQVSRRAPAVYNRVYKYKREKGKKESIVIIIVERRMVGYARSQIEKGGPGAL